MVNCFFLKSGICLHFNITHGIEERLFLFEFRNHVKCHPRCGDITPPNLAPETVTDRICSPLSPQDPQASKTLSDSRTQSVCLSSFDPKDTSSLAVMSSRDLSRPGRDR